MMTSRAPVTTITVVIDQNVHVATMINCHGL
jgi:hypothetical protein